MGLSTFLRDHPPTRLRGIQAMALSDVATILSVTYASDSGGGAAGSWTAAGTTECRIDPAGGAGMRLVGGRIDERSTHVVTTPADAIVESAQRFVIAGRGTFEILMTHRRTGALTQRFEVIEIA